MKVEERWPPVRSVREHTVPFLSLEKCADVCIAELAAMLSVWRMGRPPHSKPQTFTYVLTLVESESSKEASA